jgi:hypothetical protein
MIGCRGGKKILLMARVTIRIGIGIVGCSMAVSASYCCMSLYKRKYIVVYTGSCPGKCAYLMAQCTIFRHSGLNVIRVCCCKIIFTVTINTINTDCIKTRQAFRLVTLETISRSMGSKQGEAAHLMNFINIIDQP